MHHPMNSVPFANNLDQNISLTAPINHTIKLLKVVCLIPFSSLPHYRG